jgi:DNA-binding NtrC family response regulator
MDMVQDSLRVLLVDDDINICRTLSISLKSFNCKVTLANSVEEAVQLLKPQGFDLVLSDFRMGKKTGTDLIREAKKIDPQLLITVMTAFASIDNAIEVTREGAFDYLPKPFTQAQLGHLLKKVNLVVGLRRENDQLKKSSHREVFSGFTSVANLRLEEFVNKLAPTEATVLLIGESGTGKSELARTIHKKSSRCTRPFVVVNCTSLAESLLESEVFGHVKGAFTGAIHDKAGKFELANHGTLFLDEIGDLSLSSQSKLLRFLQERVIERVGSNTSLTIDARVIAATNKNLIEEVEIGRFREDLYYRLNIFECNLVPIRFRKEDLPVFIQKFMKEFSTAAHLVQAPVIPDPVMQTLLSYSWPGNIREIRNVIERIIVLSSGKPVQMSDLPDPVVHPRKSGRPDLTQSEVGLVTLAEVERLHINRVLEVEKNQEKAAEILGITKVTLWRKRKEFGLQ